jgi:DNA-binding PadR family transcriptional regulator
MSLRHGLLGLLVDGPSSGYDLVKRFDTSLANVWPATQSQVYGDLAHLNADELIDVAPEGPRGRKEYTITEAGLAELRRWLTEPLVERPRRNEELLQVFFLGVLTLDESVALLSRLAGLAAQRYDKLKAVEASVDWDATTITGGLGLEHGLRLRMMQKEWARWAIEQISPQSRPQIST